MCSWIPIVHILFSFFIRFHKIDFYLGHKEEGAGKREKSKKWFLFLGKLMVIIYFGYLGVKFTFWIKISLDWVTQNDMTILSLSLSLLFLKRYKYMEWTSKVKSSIVREIQGFFLSQNPPEKGILKRDISI